MCCTLWIGLRGDAAEFLSELEDGVGGLALGRVLGARSLLGPHRLGLAVILRSPAKKACGSCRAFGVGSSLLAAVSGLAVQKAVCTRVVSMVLVCVSVEGICAGSGIG